MDFYIKTEYSILFILPVILLSVFISYFYYKNINIRKSKRIFLGILRAITISALLFLFLYPVIYYFSSREEKQLGITLIDNSLSLNIENRKEKSLKSLESLVSSINNLDVEHKIYTFSDGVGDIIDKNNLPAIIFDSTNNLTTNLSNTISYIFNEYSGRNVAFINIVSDGIINDGGNPAYSGAVNRSKINFMLTGDTVQKQDLLIKNIYFNKIAFTESSVPIKTDISSYGYDKSIKVSLYEDGNKIDEKRIDVNSGRNEYSVNFKTISGSASVRKYKVEIEKSLNEITNKNNYREFYIKFISNKIKVIVFSGAPSSDFAFLSEELKKVNNIYLQIFTQKSQNEFYEGTPAGFENSNVFIFIDFPNKFTNIEFLNNLREIIDRNNPSVFFISGRNIDYDKLKLLEPYIPFYIEQLSNTETETGLNSTVAINQDIYRDNVIFGILKNLPKVFAVKNRYISKPGTNTLAVSTATGEPAYILSNPESRKSACMLFHGFHRWRLNKYDIDGSAVLNKIVSETILFITDLQKTKMFNVETAKQVFTVFENIKFIGELYDKKDAGIKKIRLKILRDNYYKEIELIKDINGTYKNELFINEPGDYTVLCELLSAGNVIDNDYIKFSIGEDNYEYLITKSNPDILKSLAETSNGENLTYSDDNRIKETLEKQITGERKISRFYKNFPLTSSLLYLLIIALFISVEWFFRKRYNLN